MLTLVIPLAAFIGCWLTLALLLRRKNILPLDNPNERSLHSQATPRIGGIGILTGVALAAILHWPPELAVMLAAALFLAFVSLLDDYLDIPINIRFLAHLLAAAGFLMVTFYSSGAWLLGLVLLFALIWMTNLYNFMDGSDGLAGGMALFGFATYAWLAWTGGNIQLAIICVSISATVLAFLSFNFPPARIFMGDSGSVPLGFLAGSVGLLGWYGGLWHGSIPLLVFSPFIVDATVTLLRRGVNKEKIWRAHCSHYYQRLVRMGWSHRRLALTEYSVMAAAACSSILMDQHPQIESGVIMAWSLFYLVVMVTIDWRWREGGYAI